MTFINQLRDNGRNLGLLAVLGTAAVGSGCGTTWEIMGGPIYADETTVETCMSLGTVEDYEDICDMFSGEDDEAYEACENGFLAARNRTDSFIERELAEGGYKAVVREDEVDLEVAVGFSETEGRIVELDENAYVSLLKKSLFVVRDYGDPFISCSYTWLEGDNVCHDGMYEVSSMAGTELEYSATPEVQNGREIRFLHNVPYMVDDDCFGILSGATLSTDNDSGENEFSETTIGEYNSLLLAESLIKGRIDGVEKEYIEMNGYSSDWLLI